VRVDIATSQSTGELALHSHIGISFFRPSGGDGDKLSVMPSTMMVHPHNGCHDSEVPQSTFFDDVSPARSSGWALTTANDRPGRVRKTPFNFMQR
jgi:hypothetical protein